MSNGQLGGEGGEGKGKKKTFPGDMDIFWKYAM